MVLKMFTGKTALGREPNWYPFLFVTMVVAWILGITFGNMNYSESVLQYYEYVGLDMFPEVSPMHTRGTSVMSAGRVFFGNTSVLDTRRSMGFKNVDTYCVAPISVVQGGVTMP